MLRSALLLVAIAVAPLGDRWPLADGRWPPEAPKKTVAVLYFDNYTGRTDYDPIGRGIASMMISDLSSVEEIQFVERERVQDLETEMEASHSKYYDSTTAIRMGRIVSAEYVITGALTALQPNIRIDTRVIRVATGEIVKTAQVTGKEDKFFDLEKELANKLIDGLGIALSPEEQQQLAEQQEKNRIDAMSTMLNYSQGLALMRQKNYVAAAPKLQSALSASPNSALVEEALQEVEKAAAAKLLEEANKKGKNLLNGLFKPPR
jgi:curli biogenesis system outer membrane secretion channel CsgG